jgi:glycosyltransferase involved in cell wall biosynthesis
VIAVSEWEKGKLASDFDVGATMISNGLDIERFTEAEPVERERPYLLTVGRLEKYKGVQHMIRTMQEFPEYDLLVAGSGSFRKELETLARQEGIEDRVVFLGYVDEEELIGLYVGAEVYITMSEFEAYGMTVAESLAAGTPCVVRESGALTDWIDYRGVVGVTSTSSAKLREAIKSVRDQEVEPNILSTWEKITNDIEEVYYV